MTKSNHNKKVFSYVKVCISDGFITYFVVEGLINDHCECKGALCPASFLEPPLINVPTNYTIRQRILLPIFTT